MPWNTQQTATGAAQGRLPLLVGGALCLDFANSIGGRGGDTPDECLFSYADLLAWGRYVGIVSEDASLRLVDEAERHPDDTAAVFRHALDLRETMYRIFSATARGDTPEAGDLDALRRAYIDALDHARLESGGGGFRWSWTERSELDQILWPVARSAVELLTSDALGRVKECPGATGPCTWLFIDTSKNGVRRWCSMAEGCGAVAKARRQTARRRTGV